MKAKTVGKTKDAGFKIGVRKTFDIAPKAAGEIMYSKHGLETWLCDMEGPLDLGKTYNTDEDIEGKVTVFKEFSRIRSTWKKHDLEHSSILQVRIIDAKGKSTISFHQDHLLNTIQRQQRKPTGMKSSKNWKNCSSTHKIWQNP